MLILAVDTSGKQGSIALAECGVRQSCAVVEVVPLRGGAFSAELVPQIAGLLEKHGRHRRDLAALVVATGPGSFTGLRVGLATVKGLCEVLRLDAGDRQFARYWLAASLFDLQRHEELGRLLQHYEEPTAVWRYAQSLLAFRLPAARQTGRCVATDARKHRRMGFGRKTFVFSCYR